MSEQSYTMTLRHCTSQAAHSPHVYETPDRSHWCVGIMPIWPCDLRGEHSSHGVDDQYHCPGTVTPPTDIVGPWYPEPRWAGFSD